MPRQFVVGGGSSDSRRRRNDAPKRLRLSGRSRTTVRSTPCSIAACQSLASKDLRFHTGSRWFLWQSADSVSAVDVSTEARNAVRSPVRVTIAGGDDRLASFAKTFESLVRLWSFCVRAASVDSLVSPNASLVHVTYPVTEVQQRWTRQLAADEYPAVLAMSKQSPTWVDLGRDVAVWSGSAAGAWRIFRYVCEHPNEVGGVLPNTIVAWKIRWARLRAVTTALEENRFLEEHDGFREAADRLEAAELAKVRSDIDLLAERGVSVTGLDDLPAIEVDPSDDSEVLVIRSSTRDSLTRAALDDLLTDDDPSSDGTIAGE
jgi:hypothetical protein